MNPLLPGRGAITGRNERVVWDFLALSASKEGDNFTNYPHLTLGISADVVEARVTVPHAVNSRMRRNLRGLGCEGFRALITDIVGNLKPLLGSHESARPWFRGVQRRYPSQRATPLIDAKIDFDLRTAFHFGAVPKTQPRWLSVAYDCFSHKEGANYQIQLGVLFPYEGCPEIQTDRAIKLVAEAWLGCKPLVDLAH
jgi:hypothetical protein